MLHSSVFASLEAIDTALSGRFIDELHQALVRDHGAVRVASWWDGVRVLGRSDERIVIASNRAMCANWLEQHVDSTVEGVLRRFFGEDASAWFVVQADLGAAGPSGLIMPGVELTPAMEPNAPRVRSGTARMTFETYCVDDSNRSAHALAMAVAQGTAKAFPLVILHGAVGAGKTHLLHAAATLAAVTTPERRVRYISAPMFVEEFLEALKLKDQAAFKARVREADLFMVDDVPWMAGKAVSEQEFLLTIQRINDAGGQVMMTADHGRAGLARLAENLRSHLASAVDREIGPPSEELRRRIVRSWAQDFQIDAPGFEIPDDVIEMIARRFSSVRELEGIARQMLLDYTTTGQAVTASVAEACVRAKTGPEKRLTVRHIVQTVAAYYHMTPAQLLERTRRRGVARPRQAAMYLAATMTTKSLPEIGKCMATRCNAPKCESGDCGDPECRKGLHHTTVMFGRDQTHARIVADPAYAAEIKALERLVRERL